MTYLEFVWLYVLSKELGESRKLTNLESGDIFLIDGYDKLIDGYQIEIVDKYCKPNFNFESVDIRITEFKSSQ